MENTNENNTNTNTIDAAQQNVPINEMDVPVIFSSLEEAEEFAKNAQKDLIQADIGQNDDGKFVVIMRNPTDKQLEVLRIKQGFRTTARGAAGLLNRAANTISTYGDVVLAEAVRPVLKGAAEFSTAITTTTAKNTLGAVVDIASAVGNRAARSIREIAADPAYGEAKLAAGNLWSATKGMFGKIGSSSSSVSSFERYGQKKSS